MKKLVLLCVIAICACCGAQAQNLIPNGDMSQWTSKRGLPDGYVVSAGKQAPSMGKEKYEGMNTLWLKNSNTGPSARAFITPTISLSPGSYNLTFWLKGSGFIRSVNLCDSKVTGSAIRTRMSNENVISIRPMGDDDTHAIEHPVWTKFDLTYTVTEEKAYFVAFNFNNCADDAMPFLLANISLVSAGTDKPGKAD